MPIATDKQIAQYAYNAGWRGNDLTISVAVAIAESSGRTDVVNAIGCVGLWQVFARVHNLNVNSLKDPQYNANQAYKIWKMQGWNRGWSAYSNGAYKRYMSRATKAVAGINGVSNPGTGTPNPIGFPNPLSGIDDISKGIRILSDRQTWIRVGTILLGVALVIFALTKMTAQNKNVTGVVKLAADIIPAGKVAKAAGVASKTLKAVK